VRTRRPALLSLLASLSVVLASGCASLPLSRSYLGSTAFGTSAIAPADWVRFDAAAVLADAPEAPPPSFIEGFGLPGVDPTRPMLGALPGGVLVVNLYPGVEATRAAARNALLTDLDASLASGAAALVEESPPAADGPWERRSLLMDLQVDVPADDSRAAGSVRRTVARVLQVTMVGTTPTGKDAAGADVYPLKTLIVGCELSCFAANESVLRAVVDSWRVS